MDFAIVDLVSAGLRSWWWIPAWQVDHARLYMYKIHAANGSQAGLYDGTDRIHFHSRQSPSDSSDSLPAFPRGVRRVCSSEERAAHCGLRTAALITQNIGWLGVRRSFR